jgi:3-methyladenine DNA glycosylase AlkD
VLALIQREARDRRNFVRKAVNWALRQIGKRNRALNAQAIQVAESIRDQNNGDSRWVAVDALRELTNPAVQARLP